MIHNWDIQELMKGEKIIDSKKKCNLICSKSSWKDFLQTSPVNYLKFLQNCNKTQKFKGNYFLIAFLIDPSTPMNDQDRISPYKIYTISTR